MKPKNLRFAADLVVKTVTSIVRTAASDYPKEVASGELADELSQMITSYLMLRPV